MLNIVVLNGRITKDLELRKSQNGGSNLRFTLAVQKNFKNQNGEYDSNFINCIAFNKTAEMISNHFNKGDGIIVQGELTTGQYENQQGQTVYTTDVQVNNIQFPQGKKQQSNNSTNNGFNSYNNNQNNNFNVYNPNNSFDDFDFDKTNNPFFE